MFILLDVGQSLPATTASCRVREIISTRRSVTVAALQLRPTFAECYRAARVSERTTPQVRMLTETSRSGSGSSPLPSGRGSEWCGPLVAVAGKEPRYLLEADHERFTGLSPNMIGEHVSIVEARNSADQNAPDARRPLAKNDARGSELFLHRVAYAIGVAAILERADLNGEKSWSRRRLRRRGDDVETDLRDARSDQIDRLSGRMRKIDDASIDERSAIDDPHFDRFSVGEIRDAYPRVERQRAMRGRQFFHVVNLAVGRGPSVIGMSIPARDTGFRALRQHLGRA